MTHWATTAYGTRIDEFKVIVVIIKFRLKLQTRTMLTFLSFHRHWEKNTIINIFSETAGSVCNARLSYLILILRQQANFKKLVKFDNILKSLHAKSFHQGANVLFIENNSVVFQHGDEIHSQYRTPLIGHLPLLQLTSHLPPKGGNDLVTLRTDAYYLNETNHLSGHWSRKNYTRVQQTFSLYWESKASFSALESSLVDLSWAGGAVPVNFRVFADCQWVSATRKNSKVSQQIYSCSYQCNSFILHLPELEYEFDVVPKLLLPYAAAPLLSMPVMSPR